MHIKHNGLQWIQMLCGGTRTQPTPFFASFKYFEFLFECMPGLERCTQLPQLSLPQCVCVRVESHKYCSNLCRNSNGFLFVFFLSIQEEQILQF